MNPTRGEWLYGRHPVMEALQAGRRHVYELRGQSGVRDDDDFSAIAARVAKAGGAVHFNPRHDLDDLCGGGNHQGVALRVGHYPYGGFDQLLHRVSEDENAVTLMLDHLEDPQNVGSLLRTADAAGVAGVILPEDRAVGVTPAVVRASAGASEHLLVVRVVNLVRACEALKSAGAWIYGLDMDAAARPIRDVDLSGRVVLTVGAEGKGMGRLMRERCDVLLRLPMRGRVASLNAAVAGAIALFEAVRYRPPSDTECGSASSSSP